MLAFDRAIIDRDRLAFDRATSVRTFDNDGRMHVAGCRISKANVCPYYGREIPKAAELGLNPNKIYMMYRDPVELEKAAPTFANLQLLALHAGVNANDAKLGVTVGTLGSGITFDGTYLVADQLTVWTSEGIKLIETEEAREISCSYRYRADMRPGISPEGVAFDGRMVDIMGNHAALVKSGRAGSDVLVADALPLELSKMFKRPVLLASLIAAGCISPNTDEAGRLALDAKLAEMTAKDADEEDMEDDPENPGAKRKKKMNPGKGEAGKAGGALASDEQIEKAIATKGYVTAAQAQKMANDASADAVAKVNALHTAREAVKPLVGVVAMDSADAVYKFALDQNKVATEGVHPSAFPALIAQVIERKTAASTVLAKDAAPQLDAVASAKAALPGLSRIHIAPDLK